MDRHELTGSDQFSDSSQDLSQGASGQAVSLQQISASMTELDSQTRTNADNAFQVAEKGNSGMEEVMGAVFFVGERKFYLPWPQGCS